MLVRGAIMMQVACIEIRIDGPAMELLPGVDILLDVLLVKGERDVLGRVLSI
jgi:hypothetical protein